jgi:hypothetical protein
MGLFRNQAKRNNKGGRTPMGVRFRKSIKLLPGVRVNLSKSGISTTLGGRGASINISERGVYSNLGIPGTGMSTRQKISGGTSTKSTFLDSSIREGVNMMNSDLDSILNIHTHTPAPDDALEFEKRDIHLPEKPKPISKAFIVFSVLVAVITFGISIVVLLGQLKYKKNLMLQYEEERKKADDASAEQYEQETQFENMMNNQKDFAEDILAYAMSRIEWPRETLVVYEVDDDNAAFDVDLPEIEDMPGTEFQATESGKSVREKALSDLRIRKDYARHVHGIVFRVAGEAFRALDYLREVTVSGYSQRPDAATGNQRDDYLVSVRIDREGWNRINFGNLENVDPIEALSAFDIRRNMSKGFVFTAIDAY